MVYEINVTQAYSEKRNPSAPITSMPVSLSRIIHHSHSFTRLEIYHHIYFIDNLMFAISRDLGHGIMAHIP